MDSNRDTNLQDLHGTYEGQLLLANNDEISGWAIGPNIGKSALITILINGIAVTKVHADRVEYSPKNQSHNKPCGFRLSLHQSLIEKLPIANQVEARFPNGRKLDFGDQFVCALKGVQTADEDDLAKAMKSGRRLSSKSGMLLLPLEARPGWGALALQAHLQAEEIFKNETGRDLFVAYGTLLGLVRDGDLIAHDDDVDAMFMLEADNAYDAGQEFAKIADSLKNAGQNILNTFPGGNFHWAMPNGINLDVFGYWCDGQEISGYMFSFAGNENDVFPAKRENLCGVEVLVPSNPEKFLQGVYGDGWSVPDPHFQWKPKQTTLKKMSGFARGVLGQ